MLLGAAAWVGLRLGREAWKEGGIAGNGKNGTGFCLVLSLGKGFGKGKKH